MRELAVLGQLPHEERELVLRGASSFASLRLAEFESRARRPNFRRPAPNRPHTVRSPAAVFLQPSCSSVDITDDVESAMQHIRRCAIDRFGLRRVVFTASSLLGEQGLRPFRA
jgi:hypothetical protein